MIDDSVRMQDLCHACTSKTHASARVDADAIPRPQGERGAEVYITLLFFAYEM